MEAMNHEPRLITILYNHWLTRVTEWLTSGQAADHKPSVLSHRYASHVLISSCIQCRFAPVCQVSALQVLHRMPPDSLDKQRIKTGVLPVK